MGQVGQVGLLGANLGSNGSSGRNGRGPTWGVEWARVGPGGQLGPTWGQVRAGQVGS